MNRKFRAYLLLSLGHRFAKLFVRAGVCLSFCAVRYRCTVAFVSHLHTRVGFCAVLNVCVSLQTHLDAHQTFSCSLLAALHSLYLPFSEASLR